MKTIKDLEGFLNAKAPDKWCYVGGYACLKWQHKYPDIRPDIPTDDLDIQLDVAKARDKAFETLMTGGTKADGYKVQMLSTDSLPKFARIGNGNVAAIDALIRAYEGRSGGGALFQELTKKTNPGAGSSADADKVKKRQERLAFLKEAKKKGG